MRTPKIDRNRSKLASQASSWYNESVNSVVPERCWKHPQAWTNLFRRFVMDTIPSTSGIYKITCTANKRIYIGSAVNLQHRKNCHFYDLRQNRHHSQHL